MSGASRLERGLREVSRRLLAERGTTGYWAGELSTSALSTATASFALYLASAARGGAARDRELVQGGLDWLAANANADGGWGDTVRSASNVSTTTLCWATLGCAPSRSRDPVALTRAASWLRERVGSLEPAALSQAILAVYGEDRTFSVPILTHCALAGRLGAGREAWAQVLPLPFELAAVPRRWFRFVGLPVVSYALPALIAMGVARHHHRPTRWPVSRLLRDWTRSRCLRVLREIQPQSGGFLEATPLTSFVAMSLVGSGLDDDPVTHHALDFLRRSVRRDGSWPIDTNLATWVTTLSVNALDEANLLESSLRPDERQKIRDWLLGQQYAERHPYTGAAPGAWAWTDLPGGVPDADDTPGALLALRRLEPPSEAARRSAARGVRWLLDLQNRDGGVPTFCRGRGKLAFDRSGPDLTAHALRALLAWRDDLAGDGDDPTSREIDTAVRSALSYLGKSQNPDGSWTPLWFGNELAPGAENRSYGTARVVVALGEIERRTPRDLSGLRDPAVRWLLGAQNPDGGWGGAAGVESSVEETAVVVDALSRAGTSPPADARRAVELGVDWLLDALERGALDAPTPIGFYFASLWYFEKLYPLIFTTAALGRAQRLLE